MTGALREAIATRLPSTRLGATLATALLWAAALLLSGISVQIWEGRIAPVRDILGLLAGVPLAPSALALLLMPVVALIAKITGIPPDPLLLLAWFTVVVGYWATAAWLSWGSSWHRSPETLLALSVFLVVSAPISLIVALEVARI